MQTVTQKYVAIKRLAELKLTKEGDRYRFISEMRLVQDLCITLEIDSDTIIQYFVWNAMPSSLQSQLVNICNTNKPNLNDINSNMFKALDRYKDVARTEYGSSSKNAKSARSYEHSVSSFAANVNYDKSSESKRYQFCSLCSDERGSKETSHSTKNCNIYKTPMSKINRLKELNACYRCGYANHTIVKCTFEFFRKCSYCNGDHMSFLRTKSSQTPSTSSNIHAKKDKNKTSHQVVNSGVVWVETAYHINVGGKAILPTFQCKIGGTQIRAMKDSGCQVHFILTELAETNNLPVICDNYNVTVNGFNEEKDYVTKVVSVP